MSRFDRLKPDPDDSHHEQLMFLARIPSILEEGDIRLRFPRPGDGPILMGGLQNSGLFPRKYFSRYRHFSGLAARRWARKTFVFSYIIEVGPRPIGLAGFRKITPGESAEMALLIFSERDRRCGYGGRTVALCIDALKRSFSLKRLVAEVEHENIASLSFLKKIGFIEVPRAGDGRDIKMIRYLEKKLKEFPVLQMSIFQCDCMKRQG